MSHVKQLNQRSVIWFIRSWIYSGRNIFIMFMIPDCITGRREWNKRCLYNVNSQCTIEAEFETHQFQVWSWSENSLLWLVQGSEHLGASAPVHTITVSRRSSSSDLTSYTTLFIQLTTFDVFLVMRPLLRVLVQRRLQHLLSIMLTCLNESRLIDVQNGDSWCSRTTTVHM